MNSPDTDSPLAAIAAFVRILDQLAISYFIGGSFASSTRGEFRTTNNIDFVCSIAIDKVAPFLQALTDDFICDEIAITKAISERRSFNVIHEASLLKIDVFTKLDSFSREQLERAEWVTLPGIDQRVKVATAEDVILAKLVWYKMGNCISDQQWRDILGVLRVQGPSLDLEYLKKWATELELIELLSKLVEQVKP